jgi:hypothetical protein
MTRLEILHERRDEGRCERTARVPLGLGCTNGHFPGLPAIETARTLLGGAGPRRIEALKFKQLLRPGETIVLIVERSARSARFSVERGGVLISSGRLVFDGAPAAP